MKVNIPKSDTTARFENSTFTREELNQIAQASWLRGLSFINCAITDEDVLPISTLPKLVNLMFENTGITDKALEYLTRLPQLTYLFITKAHINGEGFTHFQEHKKLECLWVCSTVVDDSGLKIIAGIPKLATLRVDDTKVTFDGLLAIAGHPKINVVANNLFTKEQMEHFELTQLKLAKKKTTVDEVQAELAKTRLLAFFDAVTEWEKLANAEGFSDNVARQCEAIFQTYCTNKPRQGHRPHSLHYSGAPDYTYGQQHIIDVEQVSANKITFYTKDHIDFLYRYILVRKDGEWKIDEGQWQSGGWKKRGL
ncbi:NTF2 fold immunity protein [Chitinophaga sp. 212800010-3]|uniref:NTF2 fold immunity protein n=1 Tax=unclassified Chitinophaga TaxID=2619133 RepID=UPI002DE5AEAE|nr:hypothetical protein [Chitinophaga sp. 212800010-3]